MQPDAGRQRHVRHVRPVGHDHDRRGGSASRGRMRSTSGTNAGRRTARVLGVVDDVGDLLVEEPRVDGVADRAHAGGGVVELEVPVAVPGQRADAVVAAHAQPLQRPREAPRPALRLAVGVAVPAAVDRVAHHLAPAVVAGGEGQDGRHQQRLPLHQPRISASLTAVEAGRIHAMRSLAKRLPRSAPQRLAQPVQQHARAPLARAGVVVAVEEGALLGDAQRRPPRSGRLELKGGERDRDLPVVEVHLVGVDERSFGTMSW